MKFSNPPPNISSITIQKNFDLNFFFRRALALNYNPFAINQAWTPLTPSKLTKSSATPEKKIPHVTSQVLLRLVQDDLLTSEMEKERLVTDLKIR